jgi:general stress protein 26
VKKQKVAEHSASGLPDRVARVIVADSSASIVMESRSCPAGTHVTFTKEKYWNPMEKQFFKTPKNTDFVVLVFTALEITYHGKNMAATDVWKR